MEETGKAQELFGQLTAKTIETMSVWAEVKQRVLRELVELGAASTKEGLRLYTDLSRSALDTLRENQAALLRWQSAWTEGPKDPAAWYQKAVNEGINGAQQAFKRVEENAQAVTRTAERLQATAEQAGKTIQESVTGAVSKTKEIYATA